MHNDNAPSGYQISADQGHHDGSLVTELIHKFSFFFNFTTRKRKKISKSNTKNKYIKVTSRNQITNLTGRRKLIIIKKTITYVSYSISSPLPLLLYLFHLLSRVSCLTVFQNLLSSFPPSTRIF